MFDFLRNNTLSRAELSESEGHTLNIHYGDILVKFGEVIDANRDALPRIADDGLTERLSCHSLADGDVIIADTAEDEAVGKCSELRGCGSERIVSGLHTIACRPMDEFAQGYLGYYLNSPAFHNQLLPLMQGIKVISVSKGAISDTDVRFPSLPEQHAIGQSLSSLDSLITLHQRKCQYRGLYGYLSWEQRKLGEFSKKKTTKNADGALSETFTNSAEQGVISQLDYFDHDITNDANISGYYVVQPDDFVYNPRISATAPCGPINRNRLNRAGVMSPLYTVFSADSSVDKTYLEHYFKTSRWHAFMFLEGNSGARSDRFSISDATFFEMPIWCPEISEQMAIAKQLETADSLITLHQ